MKFYTYVKQYGNNLLYVGYHGGERVCEWLPFSPVLFVQSQNESKYKSFHGHNLEPVKFDTIRDAKDFIKQYENVFGFNIYGNNRFQYEFIARNFKGEIEYSFENIRKFYLDIEVFSDTGFPHPDAANHRITAITIFDSKTEKYHVWCEKNSPGGKFSTQDKNVVVYACENEPELLYSFLQFWEKNYPDIVTGWNSREFDIPYLINRIKKLLGEEICKKISPFGFYREKITQVKRFGRQQEVKSYEIYGISEIDYLDLYKKHPGNSRESYKLGFIGEYELGETKVEFDGPLWKLYQTDYQKYIDYNIQDVALIVKLEQKLKYLELLAEVAYTGKVGDFSDALGTIKFWEILLYNHLYSKNIIAPIKLYGNNDSKDEKYVGAFVKDPIPNLYRWVISYDVASLYPSVIRQVNIGPDTIVPVEEWPNEIRNLISNITPEKLISKDIDLSLLKKYDYSLAANGKLYHRNKKSFLSEMMEVLFTLRKKYKKKMTTAKKEFEKTGNIADKKLADQYHIKQHAFKLILNSGYGAVGNEYFQYYSTDNAEAITKTGQIIIQWVEKRLNLYLNNLLKTDDKDYVAYIDTDSNYLDITAFVDHFFSREDQKDKQKIVNFIDNASKTKIEPYIAKCFEEFYSYMNNKENLIVMERDVIATNAVWRAKKNYFMDVWDVEGVRYAEPHIKVMGVESVKSSTPKICRNALNECIKIILREDEEYLQKYVKDFKNTFLNSSIEDIASPKSINEISKYVKQNGERIPQATFPYHVRASANYNAAIKKNNLDNIYDLITDGTKIKIAYLLEPNLIGDDIIAFPDKLPKEFDLEKYVDYHTQLEKTFINPLKSITDVIQWGIEPDSNLGDMFG
jgi:DNA polymerase elongation subunit (family B)